MDDLAILVIWFASVIGGMVLTMLFPKIFAESPTVEVRQHEAARAPSHEILHGDGFQGRRTSMVVVQEEV